MCLIFPDKLVNGSHVRVVSPARSLKIISEDVRKIAIDRLLSLGMTVSYSKNADEIDIFSSSSIKSRVDDLHDAFADKSVDAILTSIGAIVLTKF